MKTILSLLMLLLCSVGFGQETKETEQIFKTKLKANVTVNDTIDLDKFKDLVIIPGGHFKKDLEKINYFSKIMTFDQFKKEIKQAGLDVSKYNLETEEGSDNIFKDYKKFIFVAETISNTDKDIRQIIIIDPTKEMGKGKVFEVEGRQKTNIIGIAAGTKYLPTDMNNAMLNELVDYIRRNSKTYK